MLLPKSIVYVLNMPLQGFIGQSIIFGLFFFGLDMETEMGVIISCT